MSRFGKHLTVGAFALSLSLFVAVTNSQAQSNFYWAGSASANWADSSQWNLLVITNSIVGSTTNSFTNLVNGVDWPGDPNDANDPGEQQDSAWFTNSGTINVSVVVPVGSQNHFFIGSNIFDNASGTVMNVSMNIGTNIDFVAGGGNSIVISESIRFHLDRLDYHVRRHPRYGL